MIDINSDGHLTPSELSETLTNEPSLLKVLMHGDPEGEDMLSATEPAKNVEHVMNWMDASQDGEITPASSSARSASS